jgi:2-polyprenyl-3-methyl-5-hydroxy-6-metoxy-1,4-benzoquinol methylase
MIHTATVMDGDQKRIRELVTSFAGLPRRLPDASACKTLFECRDAVQTTVQELAAKGEATVDYGSATANEQFNYYVQHKARYAETLARIPVAKPGERVCEVGSLGVFSILLEKVLGYTNVVGMDRLPGKPPVVRVSTTLLGVEYFQDVLNIDLNDPPSDLPEGQFDKLFCFEVLEHLWFPMRVLSLFRRLLKPNGMLFLSVPNCISAMALRKMLAMQVPMVWNAFDDTLEKAHFREYTPLALRYALAHAGFKELAFDTLYTASSVGDFNPAVQDLYPFPGQRECNTLLQGDTLFSISRPSGEIGDAYPDMFYNTGAYQEIYYGEFPETVSLEHYFSAEWLRRNAPPSEDPPVQAEEAKPETERSRFPIRLKKAMKAVLALFPVSVEDGIKAAYHRMRNNWRGGGE